MKRLVLLTVLLLVVVLVGFPVFASGRSGGSGTQQVTLRFLNSMTPVKAEAFELIFAEFQKDRPNVKVELETVNFQNYRDILKTRFAAGDIPDMLYWGPKENRDLVDAGRILDLSGQPFLKSFTDDTLKSVEVNGKPYGLPYDLLALGLYYNKDLFAEAGVEVPETFNELMQVCETLKSKGITPFAEGFKDGWAAQVDYQSDLYSTLWETPNIFRDITAGTKNYADFPGVEAALERFDKRMQYAQPNVMDTTNEQAIDLFATGKTAMIVHGAFALASIRKISPDGNFGFLPNFSSNSPGESRIMVGSDTIFMIASESEHKDVALALFSKIATPEVAEIWAEKLNNLSAVIGATPEATDPVLKDMKRFIDNGQAFNIYSIDILTGQLDDVWRKTHEQFAADPNRDSAAYVRKLDESLENIRKTSS